MYASNLAIVFGPNLLKSRDFVKSMSNLVHHSSIFKSLIIKYHWFFNIEEVNEEASDVEDIGDRDSTLTDVTEDPEGELELSLQEPENVIHKYSDDVFEENNRESVLMNVTEVSENESIVESVKTEEQNITEVSVNESI